MHKKLQKQAQVGGKLFILDALVDHNDSEEVYLEQVQKV